jgi:hypothetical protein
MKKLLFSILLISFFISCQIDNNTLATDVNIRLSNISNYDFKNIIINTSTGSTKYKDLNSKEVSIYKTFEIAYNYAFIELEIDEQTYTIQPIDYVGEIPLSVGFYTYQINANDSKDQYNKLELVLIKE